MKILALLSCLFSTTIAGYISHEYANDYEHYRGPIHIPIIGQHGVPVDTLANQHARAAHAAAHAEAVARTGHYHQDFHHNGVEIGHISAEHNDGKANGRHYNGPIHLPIIGPHGVPVDTLANQHARASHAAVHAKATADHSKHISDEYKAEFGSHYGNQYAHEYAHGGEHIRYHGPIHIPVIGKYGVPFETSANIAARKEHAIAYAETVARDAAYTDANHLEVGYSGHHY